MALAQLLADARDHLGVVDGVGDVVVLGGGVRHAEFEADLDGLARRPLTRVDADPGLDAQFVDEDAIHGGISIRMPLILGDI